MTTQPTSLGPPLAPFAEPLRSLAGLDAPDGEPDQVARVATARLVYVDHARLAADLPPLAGAGPAAQARRETWLLDAAAVTSLAQAAQTLVNTPIATGGAPREVWRPPRYGRAVVACAEAGGETLALDLKGAGLGPGRQHALAHHASGLCSLGEVLREALFEAIVAAIFARAAPQFRTTPIYGVIDLGFDVKTRRAEQLPAGLMVRRAHRREIDEIVLPWRGSADERLRLEIELLLRAYGLTSSNAGTRYRLQHGPAGPVIAYGGGEFEPLDPEVEPAARAALGGQRAGACDGLNIQLARTDPASGLRAQLVDFGHYEVRRGFDRPLVSLVCDAPHRWGALLAPDDPRFVRPHPVLAAPLAGWAREAEADRPGGAVTRAESDPPSRWAAAAARDFRAGAATGAEIATAIAAAARDAAP